MSAQTSDVYSGSLRPQDADEIDVRRYLLIIAKWWREILLITILAGVITGGALTYRNRQTVPVYAASADIIIARLMSNIELDSRVNTSMGSSQSDANGWRASLLQLVTSRPVGEAVIAELGDELPQSLQSPEALADSISSSIPLSPDERFASNIIRVTATSADSVLAAKIANSWAKHLVNYINGLYGEVPAAMIESVTIERDQAFLTYQAAQKAIEDFVASSQLDVLARQIQEKSALRDEIMVNYTRMLSSVVSTDYKARLGLYDELASAPTKLATALVSVQSQGMIQSLTSLYSLHDSTVAQLNQARNMERSLVNGGESAAKSNVAALQLLKLSAFASLQANKGVPANISFNNSALGIEMSLDEQLTDVRALVTVLAEYVDQLENDILQVVESTMPGADPATIGGLNLYAGSPVAIGESTIYTDATNAYAQFLTSSGVLDQTLVDMGLDINAEHELLLSRLETEIRALRAAITAEEAMQRQLNYHRDLAWTTYDTIGNKLEELNLLRSSANSEVRVGNPAGIPMSPQARPSTALPVVALTMLGFFGAVMLALLVESLGGGPFFARRTA